MPALLNIENKDLIEYTKKLDKIQKYALPVAVRTAINKAAKDMKVGGLIQDEFEDNFIVRRPTFIKSHTGFKPAPFQEFDINKMESSAGVLEGKSKAGDDLEKQEEGGNLSRRQVPWADDQGSAARVNTSFSNKISSKHFWRKYKNKKFGVVAQNKRMRIVKTRRSLMLYIKGKEPETLYIFQSSVTIKKQPFVKPAGVIAQRSIEKNYISEAKKRIERTMRS